MRERELVIRLRVPMRKRWLGLTAAAIVGAGAVAYAALPITFQPNTVLKAADLNSNFSNLNNRVAALESSASMGYNRNNGGANFSIPGGTSGVIASAAVPTPAGSGSLTVTLNFAIASGAFSSTCFVSLQVAGTTAAPNAQSVGFGDYALNQALGSMLGSLTTTIPVTSTTTKVFFNGAQTASCASGGLAFTDLNLSTIFTPSATTALTINPGS